MDIKILLIALIFSLLLLIFLIQPQKTGEFVQKEKESSGANDTKWRLIGRIYVENGKIVSVDYSNH